MAEYAINLNNGKTDEKGIFRLLGKLFNQSGVIESTALTVAPQASPDMTVKVSGSTASDNAVFLTTNGDCYHGWNTASYNVTITANSTGVTHFDAIVAYIDTAAGSSTANNPGGLKFVAVRSTATDGVTKATTADITAIVGTKPYIRLADVTVGNGVSSINSGNVVDARVFSGVSLLSDPKIKISALGAPAGSPGRVKIAEQILSASASSVTFSSIPQTYRSLYFNWMARCDNATEQGIYIQINGDSGANYDSNEIGGSGNGVSANAFESYSQSSMAVGVATATSSGAGWFNAGEIRFPFYSQSVATKHTLSTDNRHSTSTAGMNVVSFRYGFWRNTAPITSFRLSIGANFVAGSSFVLYGET